MLEYPNDDDDDDRSSRGGMGRDEKEEASCDDGECNDPIRTKVEETWAVEPF
jgi:hypothetical protein